MQPRLVLASLCAALSIGLGNAEPLGRLTCAGPVKLAGALLTVDGIPGWAVVSGDEVETLGEPAFILLRDRTRIVLAGRSRLAVSTSGDKIRVRLLEGELSYRLSASSTTAFFDGEWELPGEAAAEAHVRAGSGRVDPPKAPPVTRPPPQADPRSASAPGQNK